jgi:hypothetical protein
MIKGNLKKLTERMALTGCYDVVIGLLLTKHQPHRLNVVAGEAPVPETRSME